MAPFWHRAVGPTASRGPESHYVDLAADRTIRYGSRVYSSSVKSATGFVGLGFTTVFGFMGLGSGGAVPALSGSAPEIGKPLQLTLSKALPRAPAALILGASDKRWGLFTLPLDLGGLGAKGCKLLASIDGLVPFATDGNGVGTVQVQMPFDKTLIGGKFFVQVLVIDLAANQAGFALTNGAAAVIGGQR